MGAVKGMQSVPALHADERYFVDLIPTPYGENCAPYLRGKCRYVVRRAVFGAPMRGGRVVGEKKWVVVAVVGEGEDREKLVEKWEGAIKP